MSPKEKAQELVDKMKWEGEDRGEQAYQDFAKECALIAVDEIFKLQSIDSYDWHFYKEVKQEIELL